MRYLSTVAAAVIGFCLAPLPVQAQQSPEPLKITTNAIRGGVYWVGGGTSNTGFVVGSTSVILIDAQRIEAGVKQQLEQIAAVTPKPVKTIVVTHGDPDHVGGLPFYPAGAQIIEHENTWTKAIASAADPNGPPLYRPVYARVVKDFPPSRTIGATETVTIDGVRMVLIYSGPAHTQGDLAVYLPTQKILFAGDIVLTQYGPYPIVHLGGSTLGWIGAMKALLALDAKVIVPGHGPIESKAQLKARIAIVEKRRAEIKMMVMQGKTLAEIATALPEPQANRRFLTFAETVHAELTKGYPPPTPPWHDLVKR